MLLVIFKVFSSHSFRPADVEIVLVDPDLFHMRIMESTELLEAINEAECVSFPNPCPALSLRSSSSSFESPQMDSDYVEPFPS